MWRRPKLEGFSHEQPLVLVARPRFSTPVQEALVCVQKHGRDAAQPFVWTGSRKDLNLLLVDSQRPWCNLHLSWLFDIHQEDYVDLVLRLNQIISEGEPTTFPYKGDNRVSWIFMVELPIGGA